MCSSSSSESSFTDKVEDLKPLMAQRVESQMQTTTKIIKNRNILFPSKKSGLINQLNNVQKLDTKIDNDDHYKTASILEKNLKNEFDCCVANKEIFREDIEFLDVNEMRIDIADPNYKNIRKFEVVLPSKLKANSNENSDLVDKINEENSDSSSSESFFENIADILNFGKKEIHRSTNPSSKSIQFPSKKNHFANYSQRDLSNKNLKFTQNEEIPIKCGPIIELNSHFESSELANIIKQTSKVECKNIKPIIIEETKSKIIITEDCPSFPSKSESFSSEEIRIDAFEHKKKSTLRSEYGAIPNIEKPQINSLIVEHVKVANKIPEISSEELGIIDQNIIDVTNFLSRKFVNKKAEDEERIVLPSKNELSSTNKLPQLISHNGPKDDKSKFMLKKIDFKIIENEG